MPDSLDDFFAKKDKSKKSKKNRSKIVVSDLLPELPPSGAEAQTADLQQEEMRRTEARTRQKKDKEEQAAQKEEDEEWIEYNEPDTDYSGLRIQNFQVKQREEEEAAEQGEVEYDEDGEVKKKEEPAGPWKTADGAPTPAPPVQQAPPSPKAVAPPEEKPAAPATPDVYVPPNRRHLANTAASGGPALQPMAMGATGMGRRPRRYVAPNIKSESDFPTLGQQDAADGRGFEEVRGTGTGRDTRQPVHQVSLANKFSALNH